MQNYDFLAIGDITTDAFIKLKDAEIYCEVDKTNCKICMPFAEKIPFEDSVVVPAVGNSANAAVAASRLGLRSALVSNIGKDANGKENLDVLQKEGVSTEFIKEHINKKSNYHYVLLFNGERTILIKHENYEYELPEIGEPRWIYLSSLPEHSLSLHEKIASYLKEHPEIKLAFQPGTFQIKMAASPEQTAIDNLMQQTEIFFCNVEEAEKITGAVQKEERKEKVKLLLQKISELGPKIVVITDGPQGAYAFQDGNFYFLPPYPDKVPPVDRTGAGDSFASTIVSALALDLPLQNALEWGPVNSMSVVSCIGARQGLLKKEEILELLSERPTHYKIGKI